MQKQSHCIISEVTFVGLVFAQYFITTKLRQSAFTLWQLREYSIFQALIKGVYLSKCPKMQN